MAEQPLIYQQIEAIHQQVREFIEKEYPGYQVTEVSNVSSTEYLKPLGDAARVLGRVLAAFSVDGINAEQTKEISCDVLVGFDGGMHIKSVTQRGRSGL